ncbi:molybdopterin cofactor-binding domain-containing protein [Thalassotalea euphylliae]|uniref:xanthine dehydrogenase family protein molybdopterin-binding subunit n=1 Tax=Thalassotalea euphylliae TaxID=1655234 RepID=UPI00362C30EA
MSKLRTFTRRAFLIGTTAIAGGVAFGTYKYLTPEDNPLLDDLKADEAAITPFVKIDQHGVTLITPRADKGQGAYSIQAMLLAEELDIDPYQVRTSPGKPSAAYYNGAVLDEAAPGFGDVLGKLLGMQITGGSSTVPDMYERMRLAGAVARETLKQAAATLYSVDMAKLTTKNGQVHLPDGRAINYSELATAAANIAPVNDVSLRPPSSWKYLGKPHQRTDILAKSTGTQDYGIDVTFDNMLYASVRANPGIGAGAASFDDTKAKALRGVKKILPITNGVAVIADNTWRAIKAVNAIDITWSPGPYPENSAQMWQVLEQHLTPEFENVERKNEGDIAKALSVGNSNVISHSYRTPYLAHAPLEPMNATVLVTDNKVEIWTGTQIPRFVVNHVAELTGLLKSQIHLYAQPMGGSFGRRLEDTYVLQALEIAQAMKGTPIKMTWSREEDMQHDYPRPMTLAKAQGSVENGQVSAMQLQIVSASLVASWMGRIDSAPPGPDATITTGADDQPYGIPHYRVTGYKAPEMVPISSWRSVGASQNGFYHESFLDELITEAGADPLKERLRLCNDDIATKVLEKLGEISQWQGPKPAENKGRGIAMTKSFGVPVGFVVDVSYEASRIRIDHVYIVADVGAVLDPINIEAQLSGGAIFGLGHAMNCELTYENYAPVQTNYHQYQAMRINQAPDITVHVLENGDAIKGAGEPGVPPAAPALANAIYAATGQRIRELPLNKAITFT